MWVTYLFLFVVLVCMLGWFLWNKYRKADQKAPWHQSQLVFRVTLGLLLCLICTSGEMLTSAVAAEMNTVECPCMWCDECHIVEPGDVQCPCCRAIFVDCAYDLGQLVVVCPGCEVPMQDVVLEYDEPVAGVS